MTSDSRDRLSPVARDWADVMCPLVTSAAHRHRCSVSKLATAVTQDATLRDRGHGIALLLQVISTSAQHGTGEGLSGDLTRYSRAKLAVLRDQIIADLDLLAAGLEIPGLYA